MKGYSLFCKIGIGLAILLAISATTKISAESGKTRVVIGFKQMPDANAKSPISQYDGGEVRYVYHIIPAIAATIPTEAIGSLRSDPNVQYVEEDGIIHATVESLPWGVDRIDAEVVHSYNKGTGVKIGILDTGIDLDHPDLSVKADVTFVSGTANGNDDNGHGTHCAGIIAALDNDIGVVGVAPEASLYAVKVLDSTGSGYLSDVVLGIQWAITNSMEVISMSLGTTSDYQALHDACDSAYARGITIVASAGNSGNKAGTGDNINYPAKYSSVIAVGATGTDDARASFSSTGTTLELMAPGVNIYSAWKDGGYNTISGTSMACPHVAGAVALAKVAFPGWTNVKLREQLKAKADDLGAVGFDTKYGYGLVDADESAPTPSDLPPVTSNVACSPSPTNGATSVTLTANIDDSYTGNSNIIAAEYFIHTVGADETGIPINASDGMFDSPTEAVMASIDIAGWAVGQYTLYVHGKDAAGIWGAVKSVVLNVTEKPSNSMYAQSITFSAKKSGSNITLYTDVKVVTGSGIALANANVKMTLASGTSSWNFSGNTGTNGIVRFTLSKAKPDNYTATITGITHSINVWNTAQGVTSASCTLNTTGTVTSQTASTKNSFCTFIESYPNPCRGETNVSYALDKPGAVAIKIYNIQGQLVRTLVDNVMDIGNYTAYWNGKSDNGNKVSAGIYLYQIKTSTYSSTKRLVVVR